MVIPIPNDDFWLYSNDQSLEHLDSDLYHSDSSLYHLEGDLYHSDSSLYHLEGDLPITFDNGYDIADTGYHWQNSDLEDASHHHDIYYHPDDFHNSHNFTLGDEENPSIYYSHENFDAAHTEGLIIGDPAHDLNFWHYQQRSDDCAIVAQESVLEGLTGLHFSENGLCAEALSNGCYHPGGGTPMEYVGYLLEHHGIPVEQHQHASFSDLADKLSHGEKIIVGVNSETIWTPDRDSVLGELVGHYPGIPGQGADHAVEVIGIVYPESDPLHPKVILNDSGTPDGQGMMVPLEQFEQAWAGSDHFMVSTAIHK